MKNILSYIWQLPQNLLGLIAVKLYNPNRKHVLENGIKIYYSNKIQGCVAFGKTVIVNSKHWRDKVEDSLKRDTVRHCSIGHAKQSEMLGWFYLLIISFPALIARKTMSKEKYWKFFTERWADKLSNVNRYD